MILGIEFTQIVFPRLLHKSLILPLKPAVPERISVDRRILDSDPLTRWFLAHGASPSRASHLGRVPLASAAAGYPLSVVRLLVDHGANIKASNALQAAVGGESPNYFNITTYLLDHGADINAFEYDYHEKGFRVHAALDYPSFRDPERDDCLEEDKIMGVATALHRAVEMGRMKLVELLLEEGADPTPRMRGLMVENEHTAREEWRAVPGMTAKEIAEIKGYNDIAAKLEEEEEAFSEKKA